MTDVKPRSTYGNCGQLRGSDYIKEQGIEILIGCDKELFTRYFGSVRRFNRDSNWRPSLSKIGITNFIFL